MAKAILNTGTKALPAPAGKKKATGGSLVALRQSMAADAKAAYDREPVVGGMAIQTAKKKFTYGDQRLPDPLKVIVLCEAYFNAYYDTPYDPEEPQPPACFAVSPEPEGMVKHPKAPRPSPAETCATCDFNAFGSAERGRGKACNNYRRLAVVMADDPALRGDGELTWATLSISPTGLKGWSKHVKGLYKVLGLPVYAFVTSFSFDPERESPCVVQVDYEEITDEKVLMKIIAKRQQILESGELLTIPDTSPRLAKPAVKKGKQAKGALRGKTGARAKY